MDKNITSHLPQCPRCHARFTCGKLVLSSTSSFSCACQNIRLTPDELAWIRTLVESECFCLDCLRALQAEFRARTEAEISA